jgi:hypothetical protein
VTGFDRVILALAERLAVSAGGGALAITGVEVDVPLEAAIESAGLAASLPRGRMATGFDPPLARARLRLAVEDA